MLNTNSQLLRPPRQIVRPPRTCHSRRCIWKRVLHNWCPESNAASWGPHSSNDLLSQLRQHHGILVWGASATFWAKIFKDKSRNIHFLSACWEFRPVKKALAYGIATTGQTRNRHAKSRHPAFDCYTRFHFASRPELSRDRPRSCPHAQPTILAIPSLNTDALLDLQRTL